MPASLKNIRQTGGLVFVHLCEVCGADASFGFGVSMRMVLKKLEAGDGAGARQHLGKWYCGEHRAEGAAS
jgi:hypothetical protein